MVFFFLPQPPYPIFFFFFFNDTATTEIYTLSLHDALPICIGPDAQLRGPAREIASAAERATSLTRQLLAFSRKQMLAPKVLDLNSIVTENLNMLNRVIGEDIELVMIPGSELGAVKADPGQIEQVIMNLAVNARDAMPQGGKLTIETANVVLDESYARLHTPLEPGEYVMLAISDT